MGLIVGAARWILATMLALVAIGMAVPPNMGYATAIVALVAALIVAPSPGDWVTQRLFRGRKGLSAIVVAVLIFVGIPVSSVLVSPSEDEMAARAEQAAVAEQKQAEARQAEAEERAAEHRKRVVEYVDRLDREMDAIEVTDPTSFTEDVRVINTGLAVIQAWASVYDMGNMMNLDDEAQAKHQKFRDVLSKKQAEMFPAMRDAYGPALRKELWIADGSARTFGTGFRTVEIVSWEFVRNANIKEFNDQMRETFKMLRFNQVRYKQHADASKYSYYDLETPKDSDLVKWESGGRFTVLN